jgi:hypothetical protein
MNTNFGFIPFVDSAGAIADILGKTETYYDWLRSGGAYAGFVELSRPELKKTYQDLMKRPNLLRSLNIVTQLGDLSLLFEQATRLGVYKAGIRAEQVPVEAGFESREATTDHARRGEKTRDINSVYAFFNPGLQGTDKTIRAAKADPVGFTIKGMALITLPSVLLYLRNRNDPDYKELPRWQKDWFWMTKFPGTNTYIGIPKPFLYGQVFGTIVERFMEYLDTKDTRAFRNLTQSLYDSVSPTSGDPAGGLLPTAIKPLIENATNWNFFKQRHIISDGRHTTDTAKALGKIFNYSPAKIENLASGWFGGSGRYALEGGDLLINQIKKSAGVKVPEKPKDMSRWPLVRGFFVQNPTETGQADSIEVFYENADRIKQQYNAYLELLKKTGKRDEAKEFIIKNPKLVFSKAFDKYSKAMSALNKQIDVILDSTTMAVNMKKDKIEKLERQRVFLATQANALLNEKKINARQIKD